MTADWLATLAQQAVVGTTVCACGVYAAWALAPAGLRRPVARFLLRRRWLAGSATLRSASRVPAAGGCACDGCDVGSANGRTAPPAVSAGHVIRIVPRSRMPR